MSIKLDYIKVGDYHLPNLILDEPPELRRFIGKYADLRRKYLKEHQLALWTVLVNDGTALTHLREIEDAANARLDAPCLDDFLFLSAPRCNENREPAAWQAPTFLINFNKIIAPN